MHVLYLASHAKGWSGSESLPTCGLLAILGASTSESARILSGGGPLRGCPRITTDPPSNTDFTTPVKYFLVSVEAADAAAGAASPDAAGTLGGLAALSDMAIEAGPGDFRRGEGEG